MKSLITTTINVPKNLVKWAAGMMPGDEIIVAGDLKSPHDPILKLMIAIEEKFDIRCKYFHPEQQTTWLTSECTGWNVIQRRNIALLEALKNKPEFVITVDDDNWPTTDDQLTVITDIVRDPPKIEDVDYMRTDTGWYNPGSICNPPVVARGFPLSQRYLQHELIEESNAPVKLGIAQMLVLGDPDIDAVERICCDPTVESIDADTVITPGTWGPFNSQSTVYAGELAPLMHMWLGVGRYDDIWASYVAQLIMSYFGYGVYFGGPYVNQDRNPHNLVADVEAEVFGMRHTDELITTLREIKLSGVLNPLDALSFVYTVLAELDWLPQQTKDGFGAWLADLDSLGLNS